MTSPARVQRLLKRIEDNAKLDRKEANELLTKAKNTIKEIIEDPTEEGGINIDSLTKLIQAAVTALNQSGAANEKLLKLVSLMQRMSSPASKDEKGKQGKTASPFETLALLTSKDDEDD